MIKTKREYVEAFKAATLPLVREMYEQDGRIDYPARREAWNNAIDADVKDGALPARAVDWVCPW